VSWHGLVQSIEECYEAQRPKQQRIEQSTAEATMMQSPTSYHQQFRSIGQCLEAQRINTFELSCRGDRVIVKGQPDKESSLLGALRNWQKQRRSEGLNSSLTFTQQDIEEIDRQGRTRRSQGNRLPDFYNLSNTLRTVGSYLDLKGAQLIEIHKQPLSLTILSRNQAGHPEYEERSIASFYDLFLRLHDQRAKPGH
jgi:hypothetical protein